MRNRKKTFAAILTPCALAALLLFANPAPAAGPKVAVFPFAVNAEGDMGFLTRGVVDMLASRLSADGRITVVEKSRVLSALEKDPGPLTPERADALAGGLGADYAVWGSLTAFGQSVSMDAWVKKAGSPEAAQSVVGQAQGMDQVIPGVDALANGVRDRILGPSAEKAPALAPAAEPDAAPAAPEEALSPYAHPDKLLEPSPERASAPAVIRAEPSAVEATRPEAGFWKSPAIRAELSGIACADVDGDGRNEVVAMDGRTVWVKRYERERLVNLAEIKGPATRKNLWLDAGDVNGNGRAEIFVTALGAGGRIESFVLEHAGTGGGAFTTLSEKQNMAFRVITPPGGGVELYGQRGGSTDTFLPGIFRLACSGDGYEKGDRLPLPEKTLVFGIARADFGQAGKMILALDDRDRLQAYDEAGERQWKGEDILGTTEKRVNAIPGDRDSRTIFLPGRVLASNAAQGPELVASVNEGAAGKLFARFRRYTTAGLQGLYWDGLGFAQAWKTRPVTGYVPDFAVADVDNDGAPELACVVVQERDTVGKSGKSVIVFYEIAKLGE